MSLGTVDGVVYGGANAVNLKSIVWYQPAEFEKRGYVVPETWDEMIALADQIVADGMNPFCLECIQTVLQVGLQLTGWKM